MPARTNRQLLELFWGTKIVTRTTEKAVILPAFPTATPIVGFNPQRIRLLLNNPQGGGSFIHVGTDVAVVTGPQAYTLIAGATLDLNWETGLDDAINPFFGYSSSGTDYIYVRELIIVEPIEP